MLNLMYDWLKVEDPAIFYAGQRKRAVCKSLPAWAQMPSVIKTKNDMVPSQSA